MSWWRKLLLFLFFIGGLWAATDNRREDPISADARAAAVTWLHQYYGNSIGGGWEVREIKRLPAGRGWDVGISIPQRQADALMRNSSSAQFLAVSVACPGLREPIWPMLDAREDVEISAAGAAAPASPFINVPCRRYAR